MAKKATIPDVIVGLGAAGRIVIETLMEDPKMRARIEKEIGRLGRRVGKKSFEVNDVAAAVEALGNVKKIVERLHVTAEAMGWFNQAGGTAKPSPYDVLGLASTASPELVKIAYKHLVTVHHPDRGGDAKRMAEINAAFAQIEKSWAR